MPALRVSIDNTHVLTVASDGLDLIEVRVVSTKVGHDQALIEVHGGSYSDPCNSRFVFWLEPHPLNAKQRVLVEFDQHGQSSRPGKTVEEINVEGNAKSNEPDGSFLSRDEMLDQLALQPNKRDRLACKIVLPGGAAEVAAGDEEYGYAFGVSWHSHRPDRTRVLLHTYSIENMRRNQNGTYHIQESLGYGELVSFEVVA